MFGEKSFLRSWSCQFLTTLIVIAGMTVSAAPPNWWSTPDADNFRVINPTATDPNPLGPANVGQGKYIAKRALEALSAAVGDNAAVQDQVVTAIQQELYKTEENSPQGVFYPVPPVETTVEWIESQKVSLQVGALKALAAPFYRHLSGMNANWVQEQLIANGLTLGTSFFQDTDGTYYPWNPADDTDSTKNRAPATIGQLKVVFSLRFELLDIDGDGQTDSADQNGDGIPDNAQDTDGDGINNAQEIANGTDPSNPDSDGDGLTDKEEEERGTNPNNSNSDDDDLLDGEDADPLDTAINWKPSAEPRYAFLEIEGWDSWNHGHLIMTNKKGQILCEKAVWKDETWTGLSGANADGSSSSVTVANTYKANEEADTVPIKLYTRATSIDDEGMIAGFGTGGTSESYQGVLPLVWSAADDGSPVVLGAPSLIKGDPRNYNEKDWAYTSRDGIFTAIPTDPFTLESPHPMRRYKASSPTVADNSSSSSLRCTSNNSNSRSRDGTYAGRTADFDGNPGQPWVWLGGDPQDHVIISGANTENPDPFTGAIDFTAEIRAMGTTSPAGEGVNAKERPAINLGGQVLIYNGEKWVRSTSLQYAGALSASGTALTYDFLDPAVWRNGKVAKIKDLCPSLEDEGITSFETVDINDQGVILIKASFSDRVGLLLPMEIIPTESSAANTDQTKIYFTANLPSTDPDDLENSLGEGGTVEWAVESGGGTLDETETTIEGGTSTVALDITSAAVGAVHKIKARITKLSSSGPEIETSWLDSAEVETFPGDPAQVVVTKNIPDFRIDGVQVMELEATVRDADGNLVLDGTAVDWEVRGIDAKFLEVKSETTDGIATAKLRAPITPRDFELIVSSGSGVHEETVKVYHLSGSITSTKQMLNLSNNETATLTLNVDAADGTAISWFSSNGQITRQSSVDSGSTTATLATTGGQLGKVVVAAFLGGQVFIWEGTFEATSGLFMGVEHKVLVRDVAQDGVESITPPNNIGPTRSIPYYHRTKIFGRAAPNSKVLVTVPTLSPPLPAAAMSGGGTQAPPTGGDVEPQLGGEQQLDEDGESIPTISEGSIIIEPKENGEWFLIYDPPTSVEGGVDKLMLKVEELNAEGVIVVDGEIFQLGVPFVDKDNYTQFVGEVNSQVNPTGGGAALQTAAELVRDIFLGDIMDGATVLDNLAKATGIKQGKPNWAETAWAAGSIATNFVPGGAIAKRLFGPLGRIAVKLGKESKFGEVLWDRGIKELKKDENLTEFVSSGGLAFVERLDTDETLLRKLNSANASDAYLDQCIRLDKKVGERFWTKIKQIDATPEEVQNIIGVIGESSDEALALLKSGGKASANTLDSAVDGMHAALKDGHVGQNLTKMFDNVNLDTPNYNRVDLLSDLGKKDVDGIALAEVSGMKKTLSRLGKGGQVKGYKFEVQAGADLQKQGYAVEFIGKDVPFDKANYTPPNGGQFKAHYQTDIDLVARKGGKIFNIQAKSTAVALNGPPPNAAARRLNNWIGAAIKKDGKDSVKIMVPPGVIPDPHITKVLERYDLEWGDIAIESSTP
ncbi:MAG: hypothetical protein V4689_18290 [Verrucomicrobiota bacterium]